MNRYPSFARSTNPTPLRAPRPDRERIADPFARFATREYWLMLLPYEPTNPLVRSRRTSLSEAPLS